MPQGTHGAVSVADSEHLAESESDALVQEYERSGGGAPTQARAVRPLLTRQKAPMQTQDMIWYVERLTYAG